MKPQNRLNEDLLIKNSASERKHICIVATVPVVLKWFMAPHIANLKKKYDVTLVANGSTDDLMGILDNNVSFIPFRLERKISIIQDFKSLVHLWCLFKKEKYDCVHSIMPKAGLLAMLAARLTGIPVRIHTFTGQVWATRSGFRRELLKFFDKILSLCASRLLADGQFQRTFLLENHITRSNKIEVLADGSIAGVDTERFKFNPDVRNEIRNSLKISSSAVVFLYMGRLTYDKGIMDLMRAFTVVAERDGGTHLLIVGPDEDGLENAIIQICNRFPGRVHRVGFTNYPEHYMSAADAFCLPSYREGFNNVIIESSAVGIPSIASRIYGITDAVEDGVTGILHDPASDDEIAEAMIKIASDRVFRKKMAEAARVRVVKMFSQERVTKAFFDFYLGVLQEQ